MNPRNIPIHTIAIGVALSFFFNSAANAGRVVSDEPYQGNPPCWEDAAKRYSVPVELLKAVAHVESSNRARVIARNSNGSLDIGYMQINDWWLPKLAEYGIDKDALVDDACTNLNVGAWILRQGIDRYGYNAQGIGAYGAGTSPKKEQTRITYANKVFRALEQQRTGSVGGSSVDVARVQPTQDRGKRKRSEQQTVVAAAGAGDGYKRRTTDEEQLVWSVFD
jgi:hypothetical protein